MNPVTESTQRIHKQAKLVFWRAAAALVSLALHARRVLTPLAPYAPVAFAGAIAYAVGHAVGLLLQAWLL